VGLGEAEAAAVVGREERVARLGKVLGGGVGVPLEARVNAGAVAEAAASASGAEARAVLGAAEGVMDGLVALVEEKANARAVRVGIRALFALCLAKENRPRAVAAGAASALALVRCARHMLRQSASQLPDSSRAPPRRSGSVVSRAVIAAALPTPARPLPPAGPRAARGSGRPARAARRTRGRRRDRGR